AQGFSGARAVSAVTRVRRQGRQRHPLSGDLFKSVPRTAHRPGSTACRSTAGSAQRCPLIKSSKDCFEEARSDVQAIENVKAQAPAQFRADLDAAYAVAKPIQPR